MIIIIVLIIIIIIFIRRRYINFNITLSFDMPVFYANLKYFFSFPEYINSIITKNEYENNSNSNNNTNTDNNNNDNNNIVNAR